MRVRVGRVRWVFVVVVVVVRVCAGATLVVRVVVGAGVGSNGLLEGRVVRLVVVVVRVLVFATGAVFAGGFVGGSNGVAVDERVREFVELPTRGCDPPVFCAGGGLFC